MRILDIAGIEHKNIQRVEKREDCENFTVIKEDGTQHIMPKNRIAIIEKSSIPQGRIDEMMQLIKDVMENPLIPAEDIRKHVSQIIGGEVQ